MKWTISIVWVFVLGFFFFYVYVYSGVGFFIIIVVVDIVIVVAAAEGFFVHFSPLAILIYSRRSFQPVLHDWCNKGRGMCI